jgi:dienelactone hydrolase
MNWRVAQIVLFHHAQGLRPDVLLWADSLRGAGHDVETPDLYEGRTFDLLEDGIAHRDELGIPTLMGRAAAFLEGMPDDLVYAGFSMGASTAHYFGVTRPGARAVLLMHGTAPAASLGEAPWPNGVPGQLHKKAEDSLMDEAGPAAAEESAQSVRAHFEVFTYPGEGHLFADPNGPDYDAEAAGLMLERERALLGSL